MADNLQLGFGSVDVHITDYLKVLSRRRWVAQAVFLIIFATTLIYSFTATPQYVGHVQLLIEAENPNVVSFKEVIEQEKATNDYYQTQYRLLQSRILARRTLNRLNLWREFDGPATPRRSTSTIALLAPATWIGWRPPETSSEPPSSDETGAQSREIDNFLARLSVTPVRNSRLVDVEFTSARPDLAAQAANGLAQAYIEQNLEFRYTASKEASDWLGQRLAEQRKLVEASEGALQQYREEHDAVSLEERQNIVVQKLADLNAAVTRAKTDRIQKEAAYSQVHALQASAQGIDSLPAILSNQFIQQQKNELAELQRQQAQLSEKFGDRHPDMVKLRLAEQAAESRIRGEVAKVTQSLKNDYDTALAQEQSLMRALEVQKQDALALNRKGIDYASLQRDAASNRQIFEALLQRTKETGIAGELRTSNVRIVDAAEVPRVPVSPNRRLNGIAGFVGGVIAAVACAFLFEYVDNRVKSPHEIKGHLGLPFLGMVPASGAADADGASPLLTRRVKPSFAEALRTIRTNVLFSTTAAGAQAIAVTSTRASEGKTLVATNLAIALAQTGQRVLLIDADMRLPRTHEVFDVPQEPGLSNVLTGDTKPADALRPIEGTGLWVLPAGYLPPNPAELLGSKRFQDFVTTLNEHFAWVVIDTPPVMAVADAPIVAHVVSGVVFVIGSEMTPRNVARTAIEQLTAANAKIVGAVLNRVDLDRNAYYYSQYYRREYGNYYVKTA